MNPQGLRVKVDDRAWIAQVRRYVLLTGKSFKEVLKKESRLVAVRLAYQTQPFGNDNSAKETGKSAVASDIRRVYKSTADAFEAIANSPPVASGYKTRNPQQASRAFWFYAKRKQWSKANKILANVRARGYQSTPMGAMDNGAKHRGARYGKRMRVSKNQFPLLVVDSPNKLKTYINKIEKRVGTAKAGWAGCAKLMGGTRGIKAWVVSNSNSSKPTARAMFNGSMSGFSGQYQVSNLVPWVDVCLTPSQRDEAVNIQKRNMMKEMGIVNSKLIKNVGWRK
jgi:hypothetical protein